jgi:predicted Na+-dependent transporter
VTEDQLNRLINVLSAIILFEMMVSIGMGVKFADLIGVARNGRLIGVVALANDNCVPATAMGLVLLFHVDALVAVGFLIVATCPGVP